MSDTGRGRPAHRQPEGEIGARLRTIAAQLAEAQRLELERDELIHSALAAGWTHAQIADASGLSRGRVGQIALRHAQAGPLS